MELHRDGGAAPSGSARYALTGSPAPRKDALTAADFAANPHLKVINDEAAQGAEPVPDGAGGARGLQRLRHAGDQGGDADDLDAGSDGEGAGRPAGANSSARCR